MTQLELTLEAAAEVAASVYELYLREMQKPRFSVPPFEQWLEDIISNKENQDD